MSLDERTDVLIAVGASTAVNCRSCVSRHVDHAKALQVDEQDVAAAVEVGLRVNRGAAQQTRAFTAELLATAADGQPGAEHDCGCTQAARQEAAS